MRHKLADERSFRMFLHETDHPYCWWCGRDVFAKPSWWYAPWLVERAHIVNSPRILDRRVCNLLCSLCHRLEHGQDVCGSDLLPPTLENMVWMKMAFDYENFDMDFMRKFSIRNLPDPETPPSTVRHEFRSRQKKYPAISA